ncbi:MAG TPA: nucleoid-associated protein [Erysipelothrix sp.]|nr:nucleoid-associated protein [Erysipelothrix sp.]
MSILKVVIHAVDNHLDTMVLSEKQINLSQNVELDEYILKLFMALKKSSALSKTILSEDSFLTPSIGVRDFEFMGLSQKIAKQWFDDYQGNNRFTSCNLVFAMVETEESVEFAMFEVMGRSGYLKVDDDIEYSMGILSDSFAGVKAAFSFDLESGDLVVKVNQQTQEKLEDILNFETIPNARKSLEIMDAMIDYVSTLRDEDVLDQKIKGKQFILNSAELFEEVETGRVIEHVFEDLNDEEKTFLNTTIEETHLPKLLESASVNRLSAPKKHRLKTEHGLEVILPIAQMDVDAVLEVVEQDNGQIDIVLKNVGKII